MRVVHVAGARPNFRKVAPVLRALRGAGVDPVLVHTGQHYDKNMSDTFFRDLGLPEPDTYLEVGSAGHAEQTGRIMKRFEPFVRETKPDLVIVVGDVNSTLAAAIVCAKLVIPVAHVEAGLRSFDRTMPEEINRVLTDQISDLLFTTSPETETNLVAEGIDRERVHFVGNTMIDSLELHLDRARASGVHETYGLAPDGYALVTLHRPSNVDDPSTLAGILAALRDIAKEIPVFFPAHPRTVKMIEAHGLGGLIDVVEPLPYLDFLRLMADARLVVTDSGGIQEETTILGVPCLTVRLNTERPITIEAGTNRLVGTAPETIRSAALEVLGSPKPEPKRPPLWDGHAGERIAEVIAAWKPA